VQAGRIGWVGTTREALREHRGPATRVVDARGGLITAGFDDAHTHVLSGALALDKVDLFGLASLEAVAGAVGAHAAAHPDERWVLGRGWVYGVFPGGMPDRAMLDAVIPDRPAYLECYDGHTGWLNSAGLRALGIDRDTADPGNGIIARDAGGEPTGILLEGAVEIVERALPQPREAQSLAALHRAIGLLHQSGITSVQDAGTEPGEVGIWRVAYASSDAPRLRARLGLVVQPEAWSAEGETLLERYEATIEGLRGGPWLHAGILKAFADGVIESRTAAMLAPYEGDASAGDASAGRPAWQPEALDAFVAAADRRGWQVETHAIGDRAIRMTLDAYERAARSSSAGGAATRERRHRVEHVEAIAADDIPRFGALGVVASMQPYHADPSPNQRDVWAGNIGTERANRAWAWASILRHGGVVALGSDWPVVPFDPLRALNAAVNRQTVDGQPPGGWLPSEKLSLPEALAAFGRGSAYAAFADDRRGTVAAGMDADLVVLDRDILADGPSSIIGARVTLTVAGGEIVHETEGIG
jgi:predicted amidohydrolase YtcJ